MMLIILINLVIVLVLLLGFVLFLNRREKQRKNSEIERLLSEVEENETTRQKQLVNILTNQLTMSEQTALEIVDDFVKTEKRFIQKFLEIQMNQQPVTNFFQYSTECLDKYLQLVAENLPKPPGNSLDITSDSLETEQPPEEGSKAEEVTSEQPDDETKEPEIEDLEVEGTSKKIEEEVSSLGEQTTEENGDVEDEFGEEPDWGDAFAEAGIKQEETKD